MLNYSAQFCLEYLPVDDLHPLPLGLLLQVIQRGHEDFFGLLDDGNSLPAKLFEHLDPGGVVDGGGGMGAEQGREPAKILLKSATSAVRWTVNRRTVTITPPVACLSRLERAGLEAP